MEQLFTSGACLSASTNPCIIAAPCQGALNVKTKSNALTSEAFASFIAENGILEFYIAGADATGCVKSTCFNMRKAGYTVHVLSDCVTSYDLKKLPEMLAYYAKQGCEVITLNEL